ncbi:dimethylaniline monooxygenase [Streptomyces armeniacus]|uniref:Dimethylaniline monooxygenase n=1 Tax=Streptomyces armeniacus TaxID=83291 RepID=A0A345XSK3_9ACTN|nr:NAD(P)-binding domain-containing protein [Streptomyces armeniacus]AXK34619.1 dimethylaniline monooxygenase [Streptomyces armeniacus]
MFDLLVVGAGPYGLSIASHAAATGLNVRVLGRPMASWRDHMPRGMLLKSEPWSSSLSDPAGTHTLAGYCAAYGVRAEHGSPLPLDTFTDYGMWFAERAAPAVEDRTVTAVRPVPRGRGFRIETADGEVFGARAVALAVGVMPFVHTPEVLRGLPSELATHSSRHRDLSAFAGKDVTVIGAGQAALETATLLTEQGATARLVARAPRINWNSPPQPLERGLLRALRDPHCGLGTGWPSWVWSEAPWAVRGLPGALRTRIAGRALGPAGAWWLRERFESAVPALLGRRLLGASRTGGVGGGGASGAGGAVRLHLATDGGTESVLETEHVIAATGFAPGLDRLRLLDPALRGSLRTVAGSRGPELDSRFQSSWPGLYFAGLLAAPAFGPAMRFVHGAAFTAARLVSGVHQDAGGARPDRDRVLMPA